MASDRRRSVRTRFVLDMKCTVFDTNSPKASFLVLDLKLVQYSKIASKLLRLRSDTPKISPHFFSSSMKEKKLSTGNNKRVQICTKLAQSGQYSKIHHLIRT